MKDRDRMTAERFNVLEMVQKLESELMGINGVIEVDFDLSGFYDNMHQVIFLTKYVIPGNLEDYFVKRDELIKDVIEVSRENGLTRTEDRIEDYGEHFYFVMRHDKSWIK